MKKNWSYYLFLPGLMAAVAALFYFNQSRGIQVSGALEAPSRKPASQIISNPSGLVIERIPADKIVAE